MDKLFENKIVKLARLRKEQDLFAFDRKKLLEAFEQSPAYIENKQMLDALNKAVDEEEKQVKEMAVKEHSRIDPDGILEIDKNFHEAVKIKSFTVVKILNETNLFSWAIKNFTAGLKLDKTKVEKAAKQEIVVFPTGLVKVEQEARAEISQDLSAYV